MEWAKDYIEKACVEYPLLVAQVEALKSKDGGIIYRLNEYSEAIRQIARENAHLKKTNYRLRESAKKIKARLVHLDAPLDEVEELIRLIEPLED